jgi:hypothetical protein
VPAKFGLKFMAIVRSHRMNSEGEFRDHVINRIDCIFLGMLSVDLQGSDSGSIINRRVLESSYFLSIGFFKFKELDIDLNMVPWYLLLITAGLDGALFGVP